MKRLLLASALLLAGCVSDGPFPSLAPREAEELAIEEPERAPPVVADDEGLLAHVAARVADARIGAMAFERALGEAERAVARAGREGSDSWIEAQQAISRLEAARSYTTRAEADLDRLSLTRADLPTSAADQQALNAAIAEVAAIAAGQQARIDRLRAR